MALGDAHPYLALFKYLRQICKFIPSVYFYKLSTLRCSFSLTIKNSTKLIRWNFSIYNEPSPDYVGARSLGLGVDLVDVVGDRLNLARPVALDELGSVDLCTPLAINTLIIA